MCSMVCACVRVSSVYEDKVNVYLYSRIGTGLESSLPALQTLVLTNNNIEEFVRQ